MLKARVVTDTARIPLDGVPVELGTAQGIGVTVDNYSNRWLAIGQDGMFVPPLTLGWANNFYGSSASSVQVRIATPVGVTQAVTVVNGSVVVAIYDTFIAPNPGYPYVSPKSTRNFLSANLNAGLVAATINFDLAGFGGVTGAAFFLNEMVVTYDLINHGGVSADSAEIAVNYGNPLPSSRIYAVLSPQESTIVIPLIDLEAHAGGVPGRLSVTSQAFGAGAVDYTLGFLYTAN